MLSTFGSISLAKLGIRASQQGLHITGNNITNINTDGYTRQRINQISLRAGVADRYASATDVRMGSGTLVMNISQIRDPYLDIRYRNEASSVGYYDETVNALNELKSALDEVSKDGISTAIENFRTQLQHLSSRVGEKEIDNMVRGSAQTLVSLLNSYAAELKVQKENAIDNFGQNVEEVNKILTNIRDLNKEIRTSQIHGDNALELLDRRNTLIDQLSEYAKIRVTCTDEIISDGIKVDHIKIELDAPGQDPNSRPVLVDGVFANQLQAIPRDPENAELIDPTSDGGYDLSLTGLKNTDGLSPMESQIKEEMDRLNSLTKTISYINDNFKTLNEQRDQWLKDITEQGWIPENFNRTPNAQGGYDTTLQGLRDAVVLARTAYGEATGEDKETAKAALEEAQTKLNKFIRLGKQEADMNAEQGRLVERRNAYMNALSEALKKQGLTLNYTVNGFTQTDPNDPTKPDLINPDPNQIYNNPNFGTVILDVTSPTVNTTPLLDANNKQTLFGSNLREPNGINITLGSTQITQVPQQTIDEAASLRGSLLTNDGNPNGPQNTLYGVLKANLEHLNGKGSFDPNGATQVRGIPYYQRSLDSLAQTFAKTFNDLNRPLDRDAFGNLIPDPTEPGGYQRTDAPLFEAAGGAGQITASNISISQGWLDGSVSITASVDPNAAPGSKDNSNIHNMIAALNGSQNFFALDRNGMPIQDAGADRNVFSGSFEQMFVNMNATLGSDTMSNDRLLNNYSIAANERAIARDNISTVDLNEEGINLVQYQKSFSAACRVMTTFDQMFDSILGMGVVGR